MARPPTVSTASLLGEDIPIADFKRLCAGDEVNARTVALLNTISKYLCRTSELRTLLHHESS